MMFPDRSAVVDGEREVTYRELEDTAQKHVLRASLRD